MRESDYQNYGADQNEILVSLTPSQIGEEEKRALAVVALDSFRVWRKADPLHSLCRVHYYVPGETQMRSIVWDLALSGREEIEDEEE